MKREVGRARLKDWRQAGGGVFTGQCAPGHVTFFVVCTIAVIVLALRLSRRPFPHCQCLFVVVALVLMYISWPCLQKRFRHHRGNAVWERTM